MTITKEKDIIGISYNESASTVQVKTRTTVIEDGNEIATSIALENYDPVSDWSGASDTVKTTCDLYFTAEKIAAWHVAQKADFIKNNPGVAKKPDNHWKDGLLEGG